MVAEQMHQTTISKLLSQQALKNERVLILKNKTSPATNVAFELTSFPSWSRHCLRRTPARVLGSLHSVPTIFTARSRCLAIYEISNIRIQTAHIAASQIRLNSSQSTSLPRSGTSEQTEYDQQTQRIAGETTQAPRAESSTQNVPSAKTTENAHKVKIPPNETVYIGNLFYDITAEDLRKHMEKFGTVLHTMIVHDNRGLSKGFGYVQFNTIEEATAAVEGMHSTIMEGRQVVAHYARSHFNYQRASYPPTETLFIGSLPLEMTDRDLQDLFYDVKNLTDVRIPVDRRSGMPRGFAHVEFIDTEAAMQAMEILARKRPYGRKLVVTFAERKRVGMMKPRPEAIDREQVKAEAAARRRDRARREAEEAEKALENEMLSAEEAKPDGLPLPEKGKA
ncbi:hypothetical protein PDE_06484 [Penicillium oxalicum 114-2]|uniref:RRM domain-containing protein n=1 Tax=Penicillium oxalicum (strain 114-2 / CGMCC 5302) TaxID=933388 RepID=S7ZME9_PENO1|nr:hypothetical protein PDE_06484 [Penicillium oxalicum 114-2]